MTEQQFSQGWGDAGPALSLVSCGRCAAMQVLSRLAGSPVGSDLPCGHCGAPIAQVTAGATQVELVGGKLPAFPTSAFPGAGTASVAGLT